MIIDGNQIAKTIKQELKEKLTQSLSKTSLPRAPSLAVILVGDHPASEIYVKRKAAACESVGIASLIHRLPTATSEGEVLQLIGRLNGDPQIDGILVQMPLPSHIDTNLAMQAIDPKKDVDGMHPLNMGKLLLGDRSGFIACTPLGIQELLKRYHIETAGKHTVILGRSNIVGKPLASLLLQKGAGADSTVTVLHSKSQEISFHTKQADILIAAIGSPGYVKEEMVKEGAVVIDVGINREPGQSKLRGDVDYAAVAPKAAAITPVPGGVGPMTIAMLLSNTLKSYFKTFAPENL
jgi:methylenetetrahydrofolate dehydrogenase (NADP+)/methenyltetrahydrofolate cyclohydrolase